MRWNTFDQYKKRVSTLWTVKMPSDLSNHNWKKGKCSRPVHTSYKSTCVNTLMALQFV